MLRRPQRDHGAAVGDHALCQFSISEREKSRVTAAQHADRRRFGLDRAFVRRGINA
jgi:hypothetical protein